MNIFTEKERRQYIEYSSELSILIIDSVDKSDFEKKSLSYIEGLFAEVDLPPNVYYALCKYRAELLEVVHWGCDHG